MTHPVLHTLLLLYFGGVISELLRSAGSWRVFLAVPRIVSSFYGASESLQKAMGVGTFVGVALGSLETALLWPYRLLRKCVKSRTGHTSLSDEVLELSMELWFLQMIATHRLDTSMSIHDARRDLANSYSDLMDRMEDVLAQAIPEGAMRGPLSEYVPPKIEEEP